MIRRFETCTLDDHALELRRDGAVVALEPQVFRVLLHLVEAADRVVPKEELLDEVWGSRFVSESALTSRIKAARRAIGDDGTAQRLIRTSHGVGYRFVAPVTVEEPSPSVASTGGSRGGRGPVCYARSGDLNIAYQVSGRGPVDIVLIAGFVSHLTLDWTNQQHAEFLDRLGTFGRLIRFDKRGTGLSDRPSGLPDLETRMDDLRVVMDALGSERAVLFGYSEGGPLATLFVAAHPDRVAGLTLYGSYARRTRTDDYPWARTAEERRLYAEQMEHSWAWEADMRVMCPSADEAMATWWGERCRAAASPGSARALVEMNSSIDVRRVLPEVHAPTLVMHRTGDRDTRVEEGRYIAARIPGAQFVELSGVDHFVGIDPEQILAPVEAFISGLGDASPGPVSSLTSVLVSCWRSAERSSTFDAAFASVVDAAGGVLLPPSTGRSVAVFDGPATAVRAALALADLGRATAVPVHSGVDLAGFDRHEGRVDPAALQRAMSLAAAARAGEALVSASVHDLLPGSRLVFSPAGAALGDGRGAFAAARPITD